MDDLNLHLSSIEDIKEEEKRLHQEYKEKLAELKKIQKEKESVGQVFTKGLLPIYVLHILSISPSNGNDIANKIGEKTSGLWLPSTGGIYPLLKKLEKDEFIFGEWDHPKKKFQKVYSLTPKGIKEYETRKNLLKAKMEESLKVFKIIYRDLYK